MTFIKIFQTQSIWHRFKINFAASGFSQIITVAFQVITVPLFLINWNNERYAEWILLSGFPIMLGLMDLGVAHATASKATMLAAQLDISGVRRSLQTGMAFSIFVALFILALAASLGSILDWTKILKLNSLSQTQTKYVAIVGTYEHPIARRPNKCVVYGYEPGIYGIFFSN